MDGVGSHEPSLFDVDDGAAPPAPHVRVRLTVSYDGSGYHGFAPNVGVRTVAGVLTDALERVLRHRVELTGAGRTDRGVHARGQVVDFLTTEGVDLPALCRSVNGLCGPTIAVRDPALVPLDWSARFSARARRYRYTILNRPEPDPFLAATAWHVPQPLNLDLLRLGCDPLIGEHDFSSFCRRPTRADGAEASLVRNVMEACWIRGEGPERQDVLEFWIEASSFCHQMVRSLTGTLVDVGLGRRTAGDLRGVLLARDRNAAGPVAPPHGLTLWAVRYE